MNYSKKHCKHNMYALNRDEPIFYNFARGKKNRKKLKGLFKGIHRGVWQKRVYEQTGIKLSGLND